MSDEIISIFEKIFSQNGLIALLFAVTFVLFVWKGIPAIMMRDDKYLDLLISKFSSEMEL